MLIAGVSFGVFGMCVRSDQRRGIGVGRGHIEQGWREGCGLDWVDVAKAMGVYDQVFDCVSATASGELRGSG